MDKEQDLLEELRLRAAALVEAKEKADDKEDEDDMDDEEDEIEDGDEDKEKNESTINEVSDHVDSGRLQHALMDHEKNSHIASMAKGGIAVKFHGDDEMSYHGPKAKVKRAVINHYGGGDDGKMDAKELHSHLFESEEVDMSIEQLFEGQDLSEEFKIKITALFEATVAQKVSAIEESYAAAMEEFTAEVSEQALSESEEVVEGLVERVDGYLDYMVEQWIENNEIALERGIKADLFESFMHGMKGLFEEHMINVPEDEIEVLESQAAEIAELEDTVDSVLAENVELKQVLKEIVKQNQIMEAAEGLSEVEMERFVKLAEELAYDNEEVFGKKLDVIREQFFSQSDDSKQLVESMSQMTTDEPLVEEVEMPKRAMSESVDPTIAALAARISRNTY